ncbi:MAG: glycosyltransferase family 2 protein [Paraglaciecola polaris]|uniref:glycosyltransferase family 2 protein n=1 Tax=Paraglaciecola polaris TaxID=222814 RepID=UPI00300244C0
MDVAIVTSQPDRLAAYLDKHKKQLGHKNVKSIHCLYLDSKTVHFNHIKKCNLSIEFHRVPYYKNVREKILAKSFSYSLFFKSCQFEEIIFLDSAIDGFLTVMAASQGLIPSEVSCINRDIEYSLLESNLIQNIANRKMRMLQTNVLENGLSKYKSAQVIKAQPEVTCVVTHYDRFDLIRYTINSLCHQNYSNFSILVVDDCSDNEQFLRLTSYCNSLKGISIRLIQTPDNIGLGGARNYALKHIDTEYVIYIDDDDLAHPDMLKILAQSVISSGSDISICAMNHLYFEDDKLDFDPKFGTNIIYFNQSNLSLAMLANHLGGSTALTKCSLLKEMGGFHQIRGIGVDDWYLYAQMIKQDKKLTFVPYPLLWYRDTKNSMSKNIDREKGLRMMANDLDANSKSLHDYHYVINEQRKRIAELTKSIYLMENIDLAHLNNKLPTYENIILYGIGEVGEFIFKNLCPKVRAKVEGFIDRASLTHPSGLMVYQNIDSIILEHFTVVVASIASYDEINISLKSSKAYKENKVTVISPLKEKSS